MEYYKYRVVVKILDKDAEIKKRKISHIVRNPFHVYSKKVKAGSGLEYREIFKLIGGTEVCTLVLA